MARTIEEIQQEIINEKNAQPVLSPLDSTSITAIWRLWTYITAVCIWTLEVLFDSHQSDVNYIISSMKPHSLRWYAYKAKEFQYGFDLPVDSDKYDNSGFTEEQVNDSKIVTHAAVMELAAGLRVKVARNSGSDLGPLDQTELDAFSEYINRVKDAGVFIHIDSFEADALKLNLDIYYNPLVLDAYGARIDGTSSSPVKDAVTAYLKNLPFNGILVSTYLVDALQSVDGVVIPVLRDGVMWCKYGLYDYQPYNVMYQTDAGYIRISDADLNIKYIAQSII